MWSVNKGPLYFLRINGYAVCTLLYIARPNYACNLIVIPKVYTVLYIIHTILSILYQTTHVFSHYFGCIS